MWGRGKKQPSSDEGAFVSPLIPLFLSQDGLSRLNLMENEPELIIEGDVRIELIVAGSMTSTLGFVWFNTK